MDITTLNHGDITDLPAQDGHEAAVHQWSQREIDALRLAQAAHRPLLLRGEPGTGKTQLARAVATHLGRTLLSETIHPRFEPSDLVYRHDAVRRLADAQASEPLDDHTYWHPGALWQSYNWASACQYGHCRQQPAPTGHVILIDEIDKADSDLPNSLLEVLGQRRLSIPALNLRLSEPADQPPLILITTNEERELPPAFLRRCMVLNLDPVLGPSLSYVDWLVQRGQAHYGVTPKRKRAVITDPILRLAAQQLNDDRDRATEAGLPPPGPAEYLDLLRAIHHLAPRQAKQQRDWLGKLSAYAFVKNARQPGDTGPTQQRLTIAGLRQGGDPAGTADTPGAA